MNALKISKLNYFLFYYNKIIGNPEEYEILEFAKKIKSNLSSKSKIVFLSEKIDDPKKRRPNISKAIKELNWRPIVPLNEGLKLTIDYFKSALKLDNLNDNYNF